MLTETNFEILAKNLRKQVLQNSFDAGACHIGSSLSCIELCMVINAVGKDGVILFSKASGSATPYALLGKDAQYLKENPLCYPGGSLGHGLPIACGIALGNRNKKVYVLMSDAELNEGTTWESLMFASQHKLENLYVIIDYNKIQACGECQDILGLEPLQDKLKAFGADIRRVNGHDKNQIYKGLTFPSIFRGKPKVIIADTIKGKGVDFMENNYQWHYRNLDKKLLNKALKQL